MKKIFALLSAILIIGCVPMATPRDVADSTTLKFDSYAKKYAVMGGNLYDVHEKNSSVNSSHASLSGELTKGAEAEDIDLALSCHFKYWFFLDRAIDSDGIKFKAAVLSRDVISGDDLSELVMIEFKRSYLESKKESGLNIKFYGDSGSVIIRVPSFYIIGFLEKYDQYSRQVKEPQR